MRTLPAAGNNQGSGGRCSIPRAGAKNFKRVDMLKKKICGVFAPVTTPFGANGDLDAAGLEKNMEIYSASRLHGYLALGSNGENKSLTWKEKKETLKIVVSGKRSDQAVMAGVIFESTREALAFAKEAEALGADYLTLLPPSYFAKQMKDDVLLKYFSDIADSVDTPCLVYNAPQFSGGVVLSANLVKKLANHPNIVGVKDSSNAASMEEYLFAVRESMSVMAGSANFFLNAMAMGATGGILSLGNIFPALTAELYDLILAKEYEKAFALNEKILRLNKGISGRGGVAAVKYAMELAGFAGGDPRLPLLPLKQEEKAGLKEFLIEEGMI
jgi:4-hydroxy-2-oxoglutarate aldolase